jgi:hypothetical protein
LSAFIVRAASWIPYSSRGYLLAPTVVFQDHDSTKIPPRQRYDPHLRLQFELRLRLEARSFHQLQDDAFLSRNPAVMHKIHVLPHPLPHFLRNITSNLNLIHHSRCKKRKQRAGAIDARRKSSTIQTSSCLNLKSPCELAKLKSTTRIEHVIKSSVKVRQLISKPLA